MGEEKMEYAKYLFSKSKQEMFTKRTEKAWETLVGAMPMSRDIAWQWMQRVWSEFDCGRCDDEKVTENELPAETLVIAMQMVDKYLVKLAFYCKPDPEYNGQDADYYYKYPHCTRRTWDNMPALLTACVWMAMKLVPVDTLNFRRSWVEPDALYMGKRTRRFITRMIRMITTEDGEPVYCDGGWLAKDGDISKLKTTKLLLNHAGCAEWVLTWERQVINTLKGDLLTLPALQIMFASLDILDVHIPDELRSSIVPRVDDMMKKMQVTKARLDVMPCVHAALMVLCVRTKMNLPKITFSKLMESCGCDCPALYDKWMQPFVMCVLTLGESDPTYHNLMNDGLCRAVCFKHCLIMKTVGATCVASPKREACEMEEQATPACGKRICV